MAEGDPPALEIVGRELHRDGIALNDFDEELAHLAGNVGQHEMFVLKADTKERVRQDFDDFACQLDRVCLFRLWWSRACPPLRPAPTPTCSYHYYLRRSALSRP